MTPTQLKAWRFRLGLSQRAAAGALGVSHRQFVRWELDEWPIPKHIELACVGISAIETTKSRLGPKE